MKMHLLPEPPARVTWGLGTLPPGDVLVGMTEDGEVCRVSFLQGRNPVNMLEVWQREWPHTVFRPGKITKGFAKKPLLVVGTELQLQIWKMIVKIPAGDVLAYGQVADMIDMPGRARAVGRACKICCHAYLIPCHRVVAANGLGGFGTDGTLVKEELLRAEGVIIKPGTR